MYVGGGKEQFPPKGGQNGSNGYGSSQRYKVYMHERLRVLSFRNISEIQLRKKDNIGTCCCSSWVLCASVNIGDVKDSLETWLWDHGISTQHPKPTENCPVHTCQRMRVSVPYATYYWTRCSRLRGVKGRFGWVWICINIWMHMRIYVCVGGYSDSQHGEWREGSRARCDMMRCDTMWRDSLNVDYWQLKGSNSFSGRHWFVMILEWWNFETLTAAKAREKPLTIFLSIVYTLLTLSPPFLPSLPSFYLPALSLYLFPAFHCNERAKRSARRALAQRTFSIRRRCCGTFLVALLLHMPGECV